MLKLLLILLFVWLIGYFIYKYGVKVILTEKKGEIITVRKIAFNPLMIAILVGGILLFYLLLSFRYVPIGHALLKFNVLTKKYSVAGEGLQIVLLFFYKTYIYDIRRQEYTMTSTRTEEEQKKKEDSLWSPTKEGLHIGIDLTCWFRPQKDKIIDIHKNIGSDYLTKVIRPAVRSIVRHVISSYSVIEIYSTKRKQAEEEIELKVKNMLEKDGFMIEKIILRDVRFPPDFARAVEEKQIAQQEAEKMEYILDKEKKEAERKKIEAEGKARAIKIISEELKKNPQYIKYLYVDKLSDKIKVIVSDQGTILDLKGILEK